MNYVFNVYKPIGYTPFQVVGKFKSKYPKYKDKKIAYAGRLDPMAHGILLLLVKPETERSEKYQKMDKEYEIDILFGVETDSYDMLGIVQSLKFKDKNYISKFKIEKILTEYVGTFTQPYPPYSSMAVKGKPLFWWAREGKLGNIDIPTKAVNIYSAELIKAYSLGKSELVNQVYRKISLVEGDFRQKDIIKSWEDFCKKTKRKKFQVAKVKISCSSGTYMRAIAHKLGQNLGSGAIALEILRTKVGDYKLSDSVKLF